jgi:primary-amine oxidase
MKERDAYRARGRQASRALMLFLAAFSMFAQTLTETTIGGDARPVHPLDALSKQEILETVDVLRTAGKTTESSRYSLIRLQEPPKENVLRFHPGTPLERQSFAVVYERAANKTFEAVVDLTGRSLVSWKNIPGVQPSFLEEDAEILQKAVRADPRFAEIMRRHGVVDLSLVDIGDWPAGYYGDPADNGARYRRADFSYRDTKTLAERKVENVSADVDLNTGKVIRWIEGDVTPIPAVSAGLSGVPPAPTRAAPKLLTTDEPQGPSFEIHGHEVHWQNWRFRFGFNSREGLILYTVGYEDHGRVRSILYRGTCSEMVVPYGDPGLNWYYKNAFDSGEDSFGRYASPLEAGTDVPEYATAFSVVLPNEKGDWFEIPRAVALYERDGGLLWKHWDQAHNHNESRNSRELVLAWIATVGNYDYGFNWIFHQDGSLEMEVQLTGFMETKASPLKNASGGEEGDLRYGHLMAPSLVAVNHQHFFNFRLDMDVDGTNNSVMEDNTSAAPPGPKNRYENAFTTAETLFHTEQEAERQMSMATNRCWTIVNPTKKNSAGYPVGYTLLPDENAMPYVAPDSWIRKRSSFTNAAFWATPYDPNQMHAAGFYVNQSRGKEGLQSWIEAKRSIEDKDVVVWYTMGITHIPRPEDYPIMSVHRAGFMLVPNCFFDENPAIGLP